MAMASKISNWVLWWVIYSLAGWAYETIVCFIDAGHWANRGFLFGPICPIYGTAALLTIGILYKRIKNIALLFVTGVLLTAGLEYITSLVLEQLFGMRWWDYSSYRFNVGGRISLVGVVIFGAFTVLLIKFIHPWMEALTKRIGDKIKIILASVLAVAVVVDFCITLIHLHNIHH